LNHAAAVRVSVSLLQVVVSRLGKTLEQQWSQLILPQQIDDFFVSKYGISVSHSRGKEYEQQNRDEVGDDMSS
jgi:hypothetical protein